MHGLVKVDFFPSITDAIFQPSDWSIVSVPAITPAEAKKVFQRINNTATSRHVCLALVRNRRRDRPAATAAAMAASEVFTYLDTVSLWYEKPSSCSSNGLLPISEVGFLFYKGDIPDTTATGWFSEEYNNATNLWNLATQEGEGERTYFQKFSWEANLLLMSLALPLSYRRFVYAAAVGPSEYGSIFKFCHNRNIKVQLIVDTEAQKREIEQEYQKFVRGLDEKA